MIGVVRDVADLSTVVGKQSNREIKKRDVTIVDESKVQVRLTLWGEEVYFLTRNEIFFLISKDDNVNQNGVLLNGTF